MAYGRASRRDPSRGLGGTPGAAPPMYDERRVLRDAAFELASREFDRPRGPGYENAGAMAITSPVVAPKPLPENSHPWS